MLEKPDDTSKASPLELLVRGQRGLAQMEAEGQRQLVQSASLPADLASLSTRAEDFALMTSWGFELGSPFPDDPMFMPVKLPPGWSKKASDHDMWSHVVDAKGRERIAVFYKAAPYDRRAFMRLEPRYTFVVTENLSEACAGIGESCKVQEFVPSEPRTIGLATTAHVPTDMQTGEKLAVFIGDYTKAFEASDEFMKRWSLERFGAEDAWRGPQRWTE